MTSWRSGPLELGQPRPGEFLQPSFLLVLLRLYGDFIALLLARYYAHKNAAATRPRQGRLRLRKPL